jgi:signal transduction histidine kinase
MLHRIERRMGEYQSMLLGLRGLFDTFGAVSAEKFNEYIGKLGLDTRYPGLMRLEYVDRLPVGSEGGPESVPVYVPPGDRFADPEGVRFLLESSRLAFSAADAAEVAGFGRVGTVTDGVAGHRVGLAYRLPVYLPGAVLESTEARRAAYVGSVGAWFDVERLFGDGIDSETLEVLAVRVSVDRPGSAGDATLHSVIFDTASRVPPESPIVSSGRIEFADHRFDLTVHAVPLGWQDWRPQAAGFALACAGILLSLLLTGRLRAGEERRLRENEREVERFSHRSMMAALTASVAHELSQPVQGIFNHVDALLGDLDKGTLTEEQIKSDLSEVIAQLERARGHLQEIRRMSRAGPALGGAEHVSAETVFREFEALWRRYESFPPYELVVQSPVAPWLMCAARLPLEGVLRNVVCNAFQALQGSGAPRGRVTVSASCDQSNGMVDIVVADEGPGIPAEVLAHLFEPFHSTKEDGMGIGLAYCRKVIRSFGGDIQAANRPDGGAEFVIRLKATGNPAPRPMMAAD